MPPSTLTSYDPRPTISVGGQINNNLAADVLSILVEETIEGLYRCEARFSNYGLRDDGAGFIYFGRDILEFGHDFAIKLGPPDQASQVFKGRISALEAYYPNGGGSEIVVLAEDRFQDLRQTRRTRTFDDSSDADIFQQIANEHSLTPQIDLNGPTYKVVAQVNQSDLAFMRERARRIGAEIWIDDTTLYAKTRTSRDGGNIDMRYGANLLSFNVKADLANQYSEVGIGGWDVASKDAINETASEDAISSELNGNTSGASILKQAFAERKERLVHMVPLSSEEARNQAQARYREIARKFITGTGTADGDANVKVGTTLNLTQLGSLFDGKYYVVRVCHTYDLEYGFRTEFDVERPGLGSAQPA